MNKPDHRKNLEKKSLWCSIHDKFYRSVLNPSRLCNKKSPWTKHQSFELVFIFFVSQNQIRKFNYFFYILGWRFSFKRKREIVVIRLRLSNKEQLLQTGKKTLKIIFLSEADLVEIYRHLLFRLTWVVTNFLIQGLLFELTFLSWTRLMQDKKNFIQQLVGKLPKHTLIYFLVFYLWKRSMGIPWWVSVSHI